MTNSARLASLLAIGGGLALAVSAPAPAFANCGAYSSNFSSNDISHFDTTPRPARKVKAKKQAVAATAATTAPAEIAPATASAAIASCGASCGASESKCGPRG